MKEIKLGAIAKMKVIYDKIKTLDKEIDDLNKIAFLIADKKTEIKIELSAKDTEKAAKEKSKCRFDEDGSLISKEQEDPFGMMSPLSVYFGAFQIGTNAKVRDVSKSSDVTSINWIISEKASFYIIGMLLAEKNEERSSLIKKLESYGFKV